MLTHILVQPLLADEPINVSDFKGCRLIKAKSERLLCYDTIADGGIFDNQKLQQVQVDNFGSAKKEIDVSVDRLTVSIVRNQSLIRHHENFHEFIQEFIGIHVEIVSKALESEKKGVMPGNDTQSGAG